MNKKARNTKGKIGRNDPCFCGSGIKYKYCHLDRDLQTPTTPFELAKGLRKSFSAKYCLHPGASPMACNGGIIKAHTIQRNGGLSKIALDGHVYAFIPDFTDLTKNKGRLTPLRTGIRLASTFTGFCGKHDNQVFAPLENNPFTIGEEHSFLLAYRALCREIFTKKAVQNTKDLQIGLDKGRNKQEQAIIQSNFTIYRQGVDTAIRELDYYKGIYDQSLLNNNYSTVSYYIIEINNTPDYMCSGMLYPEFDFNGLTLQNLADLDTPSQHITFSVIATDIGGAIIFSWNGSSNAAEKLILSLHSIDDKDIPSAISRFTFEFFENTYVSPTWWDSMDKETQDGLLKRLEKSANPFEMRSSKCLTDDGLRPINWRIGSRHTNVRELSL